MIETICTPYGKAAFPAVVKCDGCGEEIDSGWMHSYSAKLDGNDVLLVDEDRHWCDECAENLGEQRSEFRVCDRCGSVMMQGYCDENCDHICEECFEPWMNEVCPGGWRETEDDGCGGYYEELVDGEWKGTSIYWTQWD